MKLAQVTEPLRGSCKDSCLADDICVPWQWCWERPAGCLSSLLKNPHAVCYGSDGCMLPSRGEPCIFPGVMEQYVYCGVELISKHTTRPGFYFPVVTNAPWLIWTSVFASPNLAVIQVFPVLFDQSQTSTEITNTVLSKHKCNYSCCESAPVWAAVASLIWSNTSSCMVHAVMKAICPPVASMQHWLTVLIPHICYVEEQKYKPLKKLTTSISYNFIKVPLPSFRLPILRSSWTLTNIYIQGTKCLFPQVRSVKL